jgi:hypothetical protein
MKRTPPRTFAEALRNEWHQQPQWAALVPEDNAPGIGSRPASSGIDEKLREEARRARRAYADRNSYDPLRFR